MSVLVYAESSQGKFKKVALEVTCFGKKVAEELQTNLVVLTLNATSPKELFNYGAEKVLSVTNESINSSDPKIVADILRQAKEKEDSSIVIIDSSTDGLSIAPLLSVKLNAGYASNVVALPTNSNPFTVKRNAFSSKGFNFTEILSVNKVIGLA